MCLELYVITNPARVGMVDMPQAMRDAARVIRQLEAEVRHDTANAFERYFFAISAG